MGKAYLWPRLKFPLLLGLLFSTLPPHPSSIALATIAEPSQISHSVQLGCPTCRGADRGAVRRRNVNAIELTTDIRSRRKLLAAKDDETAKKPAVVTFMFLVRCQIQLHEVWDKFFLNSGGRANIVVHVTQPGCNTWRQFNHGNFSQNATFIRSSASWGSISLVHAERRLIAEGLKNPRSASFVLVSDSCIPVRSFDFVYDYLTRSKKSFVYHYQTDSRDYGRIEGAHEHVKPEDFRKGSQWVTLTRKHAELVVGDSKYLDLLKTCATPDEHYIQTLLHLKDPDNVDRRSVTFYRWPTNCRNSHLLLPGGIERVEPELIRSTGEASCRHPITFNQGMVNQDTLRFIQNYTDFSGAPCMVNNQRVPCFLFARKFPGNESSEILSLSHVLSI